MAFKLVLLISLAIALVSSEEQPPKKRLIKYKLGEPAKWMTPAEMQQLLSGGKFFGFLDLTREGVDNTETGEARSVSEGKYLDHDRPDQKYPDLPDQEYPDRPDQKYPDRPDQEYPDRPDQKYPDRPDQKFPDRPDQKFPDRPNQKYPDRPLQKETVEKVYSFLKKDLMEASVRKLSSYHSRHASKYFGPDEAEGWLDQEIKSILAGYKGDSSTRHIADPSLNYPYRQNNIIVKLEGQDPEIVILGAHYDTAVIIDFGYGIDGLFMSESKRAPGADDNASGCAVLLEVMRILVQPGTKFNQSVEFHFYAAKQLGMRGSFGVAIKYKEEKAKVKGMLNLDRCGNGRSIGFLSGNSIGIPVTNKALTNFVTMLVKEYVQEDILSKEVDCVYNCFSDHFPWTMVGFPSAYVVEEVMTPHIFMESDTIETVNFELVNDFAKVALAFVVELAEVSVSGGGRPQAGWTLVGINLIFWIWIRL